MEDVTLRMVISGVVIVVTNAVTLKFMRNQQKELKKDVVKLFERTDKMMTRDEITTMVKECIGPLVEDSKETKESMKDIASSVSGIREDFIRIDERYKAHVSNNQRPGD